MLIIVSSSHEKESLQISFISKLYLITNLQWYHKYYMMTYTPLFKEYLQVSSQL